MGEIVLSQVGAAIGAQVLPGGVTVLGQTLSGEALGRVLGSFAGRALDASMLSPIAGPRVKSLQIMESREGATLPLVYGRMRLGGHVIWASRFKENRRKQSGGKGGPKYIDYTYSVSVAIALCQGPISRIDRVWANGEQISLGAYNWRLYRGDETQSSDPLIEAIEGAGLAPAYRGTAYIVFEDLPLDAFGNRLPQFSFEIVRSGTGSADSLSKTVEGVNIIPASGEFVYATSIVRERRFPGIEKPLNMNNAQGDADFEVSLGQLQSDLPKVDHAALTVAWFGDDLRAGACRIRPGVEQRDRYTVPYEWSVDGTDRNGAYLISRTDDRPNYGGTPADNALIDIPMRPDELGTSLLWKAGEAEADQFVWTGAASRPWRVSRLEANQNGAKIDITWRAYGPGYSPAGDLLDLNREVRFDVKTRLGNDEQNLGIFSAPMVSLDPGAADEVSVAQIGRDGQRGEWLSIPVPSP